MNEWVPPRLRPLLGDALGQVTEEGLTRLVGLTENTDLEFKRELNATSDGDKKELALDIASFANAGGGLIVLGMDEEERIGAAKRLVPIADDATDQGLRIHQIVASRIDPSPVVHVQRVAVSGGLAWVIAIPPSARAPHAVTTGDSLRYVVRDGPRKRTLSQGEVAERYAARFVGLEARGRMLDGLIEEAHGRAMELDGQLGWLVLVLVPDVPGNHAASTRSCGGVGRLDQVCPA